MRSEDAVRERGSLASFGEVLRWRAARQPSGTAFTWLGDAADVGLSYAELDVRAQCVADVLRHEGPPGERALLVFAPGLDFIAALFGCFYAGWIAVPAYPPPLNQRLGRIQSLARDAEPRVALTSTSLLDQLQARLAADPDLGRLRWRAADRDPPARGSPHGVSEDRFGRSGVPALEEHSFERASQHRADEDAFGRAGALAGSGYSFVARTTSAASNPTGEDVAVLQYTSGSTAAPRGVVLTHANLLHNAAQIERRFDVSNTPTSQGVIWLPPYHDMGLVGGILEGVYAGFPIALMAPVAFLQRPRRWLEAISRTHATISGGPNFAYDLCVDRIPPSERTDLDLSTWKVAFNGSEPVRAATLRRFSDAFAGCGFRRAAFYPCYGLAEATLMVAGGRAADPPVTMQLEDERTVVGCGRSLDDQRILIVDPATCRPLPAGQPGEIWLTGPSVAAGYWRDPALTESIFNARLNQPAVDRGHLRTGDLGFLDEAGELFVTGRLKAVLVFAGRKVQAEDIEASLGEDRAETQPGGIVALDVEADGAERLVIVYEIDHRRRRAGAPDFDALVRAIRLRVAEAHQLPVWAVVITRRGGVPRTSSGKVQRAVCRAAFLSGQLEALYAWRTQIGSEVPE